MFALRIFKYILVLTLNILYSFQLQFFVRSIITSREHKYWKYSAVSFSKQAFSIFHLCVCFAIVVDRLACIHKWNLFGNPLFLGFLSLRIHSSHANNWNFILTHRHTKQWNKLYEYTVNIRLWFIHLRLFFFLFKLIKVQ